MKKLNFISAIVANYVTAKYNKFIFHEMCSWKSYYMCMHHLLCLTLSNV
ncbi:hypothetical protein X975_06538, partial [Stegodyphus mimosarum]